MWVFLFYKIWSSWRDASCRLKSFGLWGKPLFRSSKVSSGLLSPPPPVGVKTSFWERLWASSIHNLDLIVGRRADVGAKGFELAAVLRSFPMLQKRASTHRRKWDEDTELIQPQLLLLLLTVERISAAPRTQLLSSVHWCYYSSFFLGIGLIFAWKD